MQNKPEYVIDDLWSLIDSIENENRKTQLRKLFKFLDQKANLRSIPASCYMHAGFDGGFVDHSIRVTKVALKLREAILPELSRDSTITCGLLHDITKASLISSGESVPRYLKNTKFDPNREASAYNRPWQYNPHQVQMPLGVSSGVLAAKWIDLTWAEIQTICGSDGQYAPGNREYAHKETPLLMIISMADTFAGHVLEGQLPANHFNSNRDVLTAAMEIEHQPENRTEQVGSAGVYSANQQAVPIGNKGEHRDGTTFTSKQGEHSF